ncbi:hypothetical protein ACFLYT_01920, partial [Nanoarchaeota archaeon]
MVTKFVLFNKGGTLWNMASLHLEAFRDLFSDGKYSISSDKLDDLLNLEDIGNLTNYSIIEKILKKNKWLDEDIGNVMENALIQYKEKVQQKIITDENIESYVKKEAKDLLDDLRDRDDIVLGLYTGGSETTTKLALRRTSINNFRVLEYGGEGRRKDIVEAAVKNCYENHITSDEISDIKDLETILIGDTPSDLAIVDELREQGYDIKGIGVATGNHDLEMLETICKTTPYPENYLCLPDLKDKKKVLDFIGVEEIVTPEPAEQKPKAWFGFSHLKKYNPDFIREHIQYFNGLTSELKAVFAWPLVGYNVAALSEMSEKRTPVVHEYDILMKQYNRHKEEIIEECRDKKKVLTEMLRDEFNNGL